MKDWGFFGFFSTQPSLYRAAEEINCHGLLKELRILFDSNQLKKEINRFHEKGQLKLTPLCTVLNHDEKKEHILTSVRYLLLFGANPSLHTVFLNGEVCNAPIHEAARKDNFAAIVMLGLSGASTKQKGVNGVSVETLLKRGNHPKESYTFLTRLEQLRIKLDAGKKAIEVAALSGQDKISKVTVAYENLIASWKACKNEVFLNQFSLEDRDCITSFIESKIVYLKYQLYEFINKEFINISPSEEISRQLCDLVSDVLEYDKIYELPIAREALAAEYANLIIAQKTPETHNQGSEEINDNSLIENPQPSCSLRKRTPKTVSGRPNQEAFHNSYLASTVGKSSTKTTEQIIIEEDERSFLISKN